MKPTQAQQAAIETQGKTLLLSAAAGSGKTSTLTQRIIRSLTEERRDISGMLIVTFTRASAADLKTKIFNALSDALAADPGNAHLTDQLIKLGSAKISTIDSFYLNAVKQNFASLGLSSSFRIADTSEANLIAKTVMTDVTDGLYDNDTDFPALCECFETVRGAEGVVEEILLWLYDECMHTPEGVEYLRMCAEKTDAESKNSFIDTSFGEVIRQYAISLFSGYLEYYEKVLDAMPSDERLYRAYYEPMNADRIFCVKALNALERKVAECSYSDIARLFSDFEFVKLGIVQAKYASEQSKFAKALRDSFKVAFGSLKKDFFCYSDCDFERFFSLTAKNLGILYRALSEFETRFHEEKSRRGILELTDVKRYALRLFANADGTPTELAASYAEQFTDIYIDEYQDVDPVQDLIFRCISTPRNRFMVGDIKQSIYGFRGAHPRLFADYRASFPEHSSEAAKEGDCETIFMSENFRCARPVIDFTNLVCAPAFRACGDSIGYTDGDDLVYAKIQPEGAPAEPKVSVALFAKSSKKELEEQDIDPDTLPSPAVAEARYVAVKIRELLDTGVKQDGSRITPKDIAVLFRNRSAVTRIADELSSLGIATNSTESTEYFRNPDVMMVLCILNAVDNPRRDVYLAGAMRSPIFGFSLDDLLLIHDTGDASDSLYDKVCILADGEGELAARCNLFCETLTKWRSVSLSMPIDKFLRYVFSTDEFVASGLVGGKNALGEGGNLQKLYEYARTFESGSFKGLYSFIEFVNTILENGQTLEARDEGAGADVVTLTTIHKSKGLEFPVCFVCGCASDFKSGSAAEDMSFEYGLGAAMTLSDGTGFAKYTSPLKKVLDLSSRISGVEEEIRVLYVALTRAREQLFVSANYSRSLLDSVYTYADFLSKFRCPFSALDAGSFMNFILPAVLSEQNECAELYAYTTDKLPDMTCEMVVPDTTDTEDVVNGELYETLKSKLSFVYPHSDARKIPAKISVSKLSPDVLDESDVSVNIFDVERSPSVPEFFLGTQKGVTAAERGTATHLFLQFCDFDVLCRDGAEGALELLTRKKYLPERLSNAVYVSELEKMRGGEFLGMILGAVRVIREQRFNLLLPASEFTSENSLKDSLADEKIAVQGVIDLILVDKDGEISLYDYKTDRLTHAELDDDRLAQSKMNAVHGLQLSYYARAVEHLFGRTPKRVAVYSTHASKLFDIGVRSLEIPNIEN